MCGATEIERTIGAKPYTLAEISAMTRNFNCKIGNGGFGPVYYGKLSDGQEVAVKVGSLHQEFLNEVRSSLKLNYYPLKDEWDLIKTKHAITWHFYNFFPTQSVKEDCR